MDEDQTPKNMTELLAQIDQEWVALMEVVEQLSPEQMLTPADGGWSPKDNLAHLSEWMRFMVYHYLAKRPPALAMGIDPKTFTFLNEDGINAILFERNKDRSLEDVLDDLHKAYDGVIKTLKNMSFFALLRPFRPDDPLQRPVIGWVTGNTSEHFAEHRVIIERLLREEK